MKSICFLLSAFCLLPSVDCGTQGRVKVGGKAALLWDQTGGAAHREEV
jgi:hypothetical protein